MPDGHKEIPVEYLHDTHHPAAWFEYWQHNPFYFGPLDLPPEPTEAKKDSKDETLDWWSDNTHHG